MGRHDNPRIRPADPAARRRALLLVAGTAALGAALIAGRSWYREPLAAWILSDPALTRARAGLVLVGAGSLLVLPLGAFAVYFWRLGTRSIEGGEFPPPGVAMLRDTEIVTGDAAIAQGRGLRAMGIFLAVGMVALIFGLWRIAALMER